MKVDPAEFVTLWMRGDSSTAMAKHFNCHPVYVHQFAARLRREGVSLPKRKKRTAIDVKKLNKLIANGGGK